MTNLSVTTKILVAALKRSSYVWRVLAVWRVDPKKEVTEREEYAVAVCPDCEYEHPFQYLPLHVVTGPSGTGKSTVLHELMCDAVTEGDDIVDHVVPLESDSLWATGADVEIVAYMDLWQKVCAEIHQSGRPVLLFGVGMNPENMEPTSCRRYFPTIHYLALVADDNDLTERLGDRPDWRESSSVTTILQHVSYNRELKTREFVAEDIPFETLNTTGLTVHKSVAATREWVQDVLDSY